MQEKYMVVSFADGREFDSAGFDSLEEAEQFAECVSCDDEMDSYIYGLLSFHAAQESAVDFNSAKYNGVTPGDDFPHSLWA